MTLTLTTRLIGCTYIATAIACARHVAQAPSVLADTTAYEEAGVDVPAEPTDEPRPDWHPDPEAAVVCATAQFDYVVGGDGRVESRSVILLATSEQSFAAAARKALLASKFRPAQRKGAVVRQFV